MVSTDALTNRQLEVLQLVHDNRTRMGRGPTLRMMAMQLGVSESTVGCHVRALRKAGMLIQTRWYTRTMDLTEKGQELVERLA